MTVGVPCKTQKETEIAKYTPDTVDGLLQVFHGRPIAPSGVDPTKYLLALDDKMLQQESERTLIEVAARYYLFPAKVLVLFFK